MDRSFWTWLTTGAWNGSMRIIIVYRRWNQYNRPFQSAWRCITRRRCQEAIRCARLLSEDSHVCWYFKWKLSKNADDRFQVGIEPPTLYWKTPPPYDEVQAPQSWNTDVETVNMVSDCNSHNVCQLTSVTCSVFVYFCYGEHFLLKLPPLHPASYESKNRRVEVNWVAELIANSLHFYHPLSAVSFILSLFISPLSKSDHLMCRQAGCCHQHWAALLLSHRSSFFLPL